NHLLARFLPDPFIFAVIISLFIYLVGILTGSSFLQMTYSFGKGFFSLNAFTMQMLFILVSGHILANTAVSHHFLNFFLKRIETPRSAIVLTIIVSILVSWLNWGFGLIAGAIFAKEVAKKVKEVDYRLLIASAYSGFVVWHGGLSGSIPLTIATEKHFAESSMGIVPVSETLFSPLNLFILITLLVGLPIINLWMLPKKEDRVFYEEKEEVKMNPITVDPSLANRLENSRILSILIFILGFSYIFLYFLQKGFQLNLDIVNFCFLFFGILLHKTPIRFLKSAENAVRGTSGIILQFPFYAGIMGMMVDSGMAKSISQFFVLLADNTVFPLFTFLSAGLINLFIPSGGGQWAVQGPIVLNAAKELGISYSKVAMAVAWGDAWTNLIQPFWALPALAVAGLSIRDIMGFCIINLFFTGIVISGAFLLF
ncbi:MAG TPA: TIGR00366 family protein, partial [Leptospiraceae bacterium]|nr:TIGR00366 family protein [Leptospiraceae bacterium]